MSELLYKDEVYKIMAVAFDAQNELGSGFLESVYQEVMAIEFAARGIPFVAQAPVRIRYKDRVLDKLFVADFICFGCVLVEIKAVDRLQGHDEAQVLNSLKATGLRVGLLINFGKGSQVEWKRYVL